MEKLKVLFVCVHNSTRSQMAETFLNHLAGDKFKTESAGFEPTEINPFVVEVMKEIGFDMKILEISLYNHILIYDIEQCNLI